MATKASHGPLKPGLRRGIGQLVILLLPEQQLEGTFSAKQQPCSDQLLVNLASAGQRLSHPTPGCNPLALAWFFLGVLG